MVRHHTKVLGLLVPALAWVPFNSGLPGDMGGMAFVLPLF